jgi:hypothetical protein
VRPESQAAVNAHSALDGALDLVIDRFGGSAWEAEIVRARDAWSERTGRLFEDDELYEERTTSFLEWYAVERPLEREGQPPVVVAASEDPDPALRAWASSHHSLFLVKNATGPMIVLADLLAGAEFEVEERRRLHGVSAGDIMEARLVGFDGQARFGRTFLYHPAGARAAIVRQGKACMAAGGSRTDAVDLIARLKVRALRYKHVAAEKVYEMGLPATPGTGELRLPLK